MSQLPFQWTQIDTVLLDLDGTLLDLHYDNYFWLHHLPRRWAELSGQTEEVCREQLHMSYDRMRGTLDWYCLDYWADRLQTDILELKLEVAHKVALRPDADRFLGWLKGQNKQVVLVTNAHRTGLEMKLGLTGIETHFDAMVSSHDYQQPKEAQDFWHALHRDHPFDLKATLFIDDNEEVLASADRFGVGQLLQILQPDMQESHRPAGRFPGIRHFSEVLED